MHFTKNERVSKNIMKFCDKFNENEQKYIDILLTRSIYASSSPLNLVENVYWEEFFEKIWPAYRPPFLTDYAKNMKRAWPLVTEKYPHIAAYGCGAHGLNLLVNDIIHLKLFNDLINEGKFVVNNIRRGHITNALFLQKRKNNINSTALTLPVVTRCASVVVFLNSLLVNKQIIRSKSIDESTRPLKRI